jgi:hypothetical protein
MGKAVIVSKGVGQAFGDSFRYRYAFMSRDEKKHPHSTFWFLVFHHAMLFFARTGPWVHPTNLFKGVEEYEARQRQKS